MKNKLKIYREKVKHLKVLYVEDNEKVRQESGKFFKKFFSSLTIANNGEEGLREFKKDDYDIIFSDIKMPKMNGWEMVEQIREIKPDVFIVMLTASRRFEEAQSELCDMYLEKPIDFESIVKVLKEVEKKFKL